MLSGDGSLDNALATQAGQQQAEGAYVSCPCLFATASDEPEVQTFTNNYKQKFNQDPAVYSTEGYDAASVFIKALEAGKTTPKDINDCLTTLSFKGIRRKSSSPTPATQRELDLHLPDQERQAHPVGRREHRQGQLTS